MERIKKQRVVILGSGSFIAKSVINYLKEENIKIIRISRKQIDFYKKKSVKNLNKYINEDDVIFIAAAKAPVKNITMLNYNMTILENITNELMNFNLKQVIYLSSDAVYKDSNKLINENSICEPDSLHGLMHLAREKYLESLFPEKLCIVRPTLVYGLKDPHNGYGPNMFIRRARSNNNIFLFGRGEEMRDHVNINDVGKIITFLIIKNLRGKFNIATGALLTFQKIALSIKKHINPKVNIEYKKRTGPMPHNGYRAFSNKKIISIFKGFKYIKLNEWISKI